MISVPFFYTRSGMLLLTTYPKFTCRSFIHFKLFQIYSNCSIQDHSKTTLKFENCLSIKVRFLHKDSRIVEFAFLLFFYHLLCNLQDSGF
jgi:hypothetical protein